MRRPSSFASAMWLAVVVAAVLTACGASSPPPFSRDLHFPSGTAIASGGRLVASGSNGVTFTFSLGAGVPPGETATVTALPTPMPCVGTGCTSPQAPLDGFLVSVGPQPLPLDTMTSVALAGVQSPFQVSLVLQDTTDLLAFTNFRFLTPAGGPITVIDPASLRPVLTLQPNRPYAFSIFTTTFPPP